MGNVIESTETPLDVPLEHWEGLPTYNERMTEEEALSLAGGAMSLSQAIRQKEQVEEEGA